ncbi:hypothetical protein AB1N83_002948 [Pleurotus pulmonarius]
MPEFQVLPPLAQCSRSDRDGPASFPCTYPVDSWPHEQRTTCLKVGTIPHGSGSFGTPWPKEEAKTSQPIAKHADVELWNDVHVLDRAERGLGARSMPFPRNKDIDGAGDTSAAVMVVAVRVYPRFTHKRTRERDLMEGRTGCATRR